MQTVEQPKSELRLERLDLVADGTLGDRELRSCPGEAQMARRRLEGAHGIERRQAAGHRFLDENF